MTRSILVLLRTALVHYGYWAVAAALLLENAGLPVPGETVLLLASFLAYSERDLRLGWIVAVGTLACAVGDNLGYAIGRHGGRPLLLRYRKVFRVNDAAVGKGERLFETYGAAAILVARFVFGMRVIAGPLAGVLRMPWKRFTICNLIGAVAWVAVVSFAGYGLGSRSSALAHAMKRLDLALGVAFALALLGLWRRRRRV
jgi:membrane-associated protein